MERSSWVLHHGNPKIWFFSSKKFEIEFDLYFDLCWRAEIIQIGLNMHLYVDIGDASSSLWGSTSSSYLFPSEGNRVKSTRRKVYIIVQAFDVTGHIQSHTMKDEILQTC